MGTIEEAAKRLALLRRAGIVLPESELSVAPAPAPVATPVPAPATSTAAPPSAPAALSVPPAPSLPADPEVPAERAAAVPPPPAPAPVLDPAPPPQLIQDGDVVTINLPGLEETASETLESWGNDTLSGTRQSRTVSADLAGMARRSLLVPGGPRSQLEEEFRLIKRPLLENIRSPESMRPARANLIMVTSAAPGEGKTQSAINLAVSMAMELDHTVLLVEADVLRPALLDRMGISARRGLMDVLAGEVKDLSDVLLRTNIPKLSLLPAGAMRSSATEMLASSAMTQLLEELANKYSDRVIIFDTPPLLSTTESRALATNMGQVVMVVEAYGTQVQLVKQAFATVESHPVVMGMLNKYNGPRRGEGYGYYAP